MGRRYPGVVGLGPRVQGFGVLGFMRLLAGLGAFLHIPMSCKGFRGFGGARFQGLWCGKGFRDVML